MILACHKSITLLAPFWLSVGSPISPRVRPGGGRANFGAISELGYQKISCSECEVDVRKPHFSKHAILCEGKRYVVFRNYTSVKPESLASKSTNVYY